MDQHSKNRLFTSCWCDPGPRQITLNVADVPSGMYFLRLSAPGIEQVQKVCIAH
ncbi:MAG: hypothetical protein Q8922_01135 [Bacteroidota bacterium]|nr:hypothetical protein [Bacteroidota bacterium]MDP4232169.1 hypothetical protein [Bacteroidota bacterium]MDP4241123.1 hypothetical protein [Bacteroidota bacterium]MDP4286515.1 hypothetical protein [Bacteroidota bacterium]